MVKKKEKKKTEIKEPEVEVVSEAEVVDDDSEVSAEEFSKELDDFAAFPLNEDDTEPKIKKEKNKALVPYNPLDAYLADIRKFKPLSREDELESALDYYKTQNPEAAYKLVSSNLWLVVKIARDYERVARNLLDLIQEGNIGLMEAVKNFDPYRGVRFPSYAVWWVKAYIIRFIIANWRLVKIGTTQAQRKLFFNLKKESEKLEREGIFPTPKLLAEKLDVKESDVIEMSQRLGSTDMSVDAPLASDNENTLLSILPNSDVSMEENLASKEMSAILKSAVDEFESKLTAKELSIFDGRIIAEDKLTLQELSDKLSISKERVRQIENKLRDKLKLFVREKMGTEISEWITGESK